MMTAGMALTRTTVPLILQALYVHTINLLVYPVINAFPKVTTVTSTEIVWMEVMKLDAVSQAHN